MSRLILKSKKVDLRYKTITEKGPDVPSEVLEEVLAKALPLLGRYVPKFREIPMNLGLTWFPMYSTSPVSIRCEPLKVQTSDYTQDRRKKTRPLSPFSRLTMDFLSVALHLGTVGLVIQVVKCV